MCSKTTTTAETTKLLDHTHKLHTDHSATYPKIRNLYNYLDSQPAGKPGIVWPFSVGLRANWSETDCRCLWWRISGITGFRVKWEQDKKQLVKGLCY